MRIVAGIVKKAETGKPLTKAEERFVKQLQVKQSAEEEAAAKKLWKKLNEDELELAKAIVKNLFAGLPEELLNFEKFFGRLPKISKKEQQFLSRSNAHARALVKATEPYGAVLASYGLTVINLFSGINAVESLIERGFRRKLISGQVFLGFSGDEVYFGPAPFSGQLCSAEIYRCIAEKTMAKDEQLAAKLILLWIVKAACWKPHLFPNLLAKPNAMKNIASLTSDPGNNIDVFIERWKIVSE